MRRIIFAALCLLVVVACAPYPIEQPTATPPQPGDTNCYGFTGNDSIVTTNHCLQSPYAMDTTNPIIQAVPEGWQIVNLLQNARGEQDEQTAYMKITPNGFGLTFQINDGLTGIDSQAGYVQKVELEPGCYLLKVTGRNWINDPPHPENFTISGYVDDVIISQQDIPAQDGFELIYPFEVTTTDEYPIRWMVQALWGTAGHNSKLDILGAGVLRVDTDYCD